MGLSGSNGWLQDQKNSTKVLDSSRYRWGYACMCLLPSFLIKSIVLTWCFSDVVASQTLNYYNSAQLEYTRLLS